MNRIGSFGESRSTELPKLEDSVLYNTCYDSNRLEVVKNLIEDVNTFKKDSFKKFSTIGKRLGYNARYSNLADCYKAIEGDTDHRLVKTFELLDHTELLYKRDFRDVVYALNHASKFFKSKGL